MSVRTLNLLLPVLVCAGLYLGCDSSGNTIEVPPPRTVAEEDYSTTSSGLKYYDFSVGIGTRVDSSLAVSIQYILWLENGQVINSSYFSGLPVTIILGRNEVVPGWEEGLLGMRVGGDRQVVIPPNLAYGAAGLPSAGIPPNATLIVEIALLAVGVETG